VYEKVRKKDVFIAEYCSLYSFKPLSIVRRFSLLSNKMILSILSSYLFEMFSFHIRTCSNWYQTQTIWRNLKLLSVGMFETFYFSCAPHNENANRRMKISYLFPQTAKKHIILWIFKANLQTLHSSAFLMAAQKKLLAALLLEDIYGEKFSLQR
jgi:hypothetical protein